MKDMGGLRKYLPVTHQFLIACLAISGYHLLQDF
jgi:NADH:ubiquinone oxidoreductase subunit 5 (subunit L)/multisubunit Na+/H+ antiporter MnhA subunit